MIKPRTLIATSLCPLALLLLAGCDSKSSVAPITQSEVSTDNYDKTCRDEKSSGCDGKKIIWRGFFESSDGSTMTVHNVSGDLKLNAPPPKQIAPGAIVGFRGVLDDPSKNKDKPIAVKNVSLDFVESPAQTSARLKKVEDMQTEACVRFDKKLGNPDSPIDQSVTIPPDITVSGEPWKPEAAHVSYTLVPSEEDRHDVLCLFSAGQIDVKEHWPPTRLITGQMIPGDDHKGSFPFDHDYLRDYVVAGVDASTAAPPRASSTSQTASGSSIDDSAQRDIAAKGKDSETGRNAQLEESANTATSASQATSTNSATTTDVPASEAATRTTDSAQPETCGTAVTCAKAMLSFAKAENLAGAMDAAKTIDSLPRPTRGDKVLARKLNQQGLDALNGSHPDEAVKIFEKANQTDPGDVEIASNLSYAYAIDGQLAKSEDTAVLALALNPRRTSVWAPLAVTLAKEHRLDQAVEAMWLAYQFSGDKQKTLGFIDSKLSTEKDSDALKMYTASKSWFEQNEKPSVLQ